MDTEINQTFCRMVRIGSMFQSLDKLEKLILSSNLIERLERINFNDLTNLERLYLDHNEVNFKTVIHPV